MTLPKYTFLTTCLCLCGLLLTSTELAAREFKCWKNSHGIRECGSIVPPEYAQGRIEVVNERGLIIRVIEPAKTREELEREREQERLRKEREAARKEQERLDTILLNAYTTERDLIIARDTNLKAAAGQLEITKGNLRVLQNNLADLQKRAGNYERSGQQAPESIVKEIQETEQLIEEKKRQIEIKEADLKTLEERFAKDLQRFRELKGKSR